MGFHCGKCGAPEVIDDDYCEECKFRAQVESLKQELVAKGAKEKELRENGERMREELDLLIEVRKEKNINSPYAIRASKVWRAALSSPSDPGLYDRLMEVVRAAGKVTNYELDAVPKLSKTLARLEQPEPSPKQASGGK